MIATTNRKAVPGRTTSQTAADISFTSTVAHHAAAVKQMREMPRW